MFDSSVWSNRLSWQTINNQFDSSSTNETPSIYVTKTGKKIKRRTRILNTELKKFARLKSYSQYVKIKTKILRNVSDDEFTEDEPYSNVSSNDDESLSEDGFSVDNTSKRNSPIVESPENHENVQKQEKENLRLFEKNTRSKASTRAKRNLTSLLDNLETCPSVDKTRIQEIVKNDDDNNNRQLSRVTNIDKTNLGIIIATAGDSGIDDDSQDNSSTNNRENDEYAIDALDDIAETSEQRELALDVTITNEILWCKEKNLINEDEEEEKEEEERNNELEEQNNEEEEEEKDEEEQEKDEEEQNNEMEEQNNELEEHNKELEEHDNSDEEEEKNDQQYITDDELTKKKCQPTIKSTEIVKTKYTIIRDDDDDETDNSENDSTIREIFQKNLESMKNDEISPESKRVGLLKRLNLLCSGSESDTSINDDETSDNHQNTINDSTRRSQFISDPSDSEDDELSRASSLLHITDTDDNPNERLNENQEEGNETSETRNRELRKKSIKDQIEEQEIIECSLIIGETAINEIEEIKVEEDEDVKEDKREKEDGSRKKKKGPSEAESMQYVLNNLSKRSFNDEELVSCHDDTRDIVENEEENLLRPIELRDYVERESLVPTSELPTITIKDVETSCGSQDDDGDDEIWLMEIPKSIIEDPEICGKTMIIDKKRMIIGDTSYETTLRNERAVSCVLRTGRKKSRYKAVNIRPISSILVRQESSNKKSLVLSSEAPHLQNTVPFPKNIKSRNPLITETKRSAIMTSSDEMKNRKIRKRRKGRWHIDNFILKSKKKRIDDS